MHILHLEDEGPLREIFKEVIHLKEPNATVTQFVSSDKALAFIADNLHDIDLFVLDIRVEGNLDGVQVAQRIREMAFEREIVLTSAYRKPHYEVLNGIRARWMPKPWHIMKAMEEILPLAVR